MLADVVDIIIPKTQPTNHKNLDQNLENKQKSKTFFFHLHQSKINLQSAFNQSEVGKASAD